MLTQIGHDTQFGTAHKALMGMTGSAPLTIRLLTSRTEPVLGPW
jgi:hypothetical protein